MYRYEIVNSFGVTRWGFSSPLESRAPLSPHVAPTEGRCMGSPGPAVPLSHGDIWGHLLCRVTFRSAHPT